MGLEYAAITLINGEDLFLAKRHIIGGRRDKTNDYQYAG